MNNSNELNKLRKKLSRKTRILTDTEVELVTGEMQRFLGPELVAITSSYGLSMQDVVRWGSLHARCEEERSIKGLTVKDISSELKIPQYRLRAIEEGSLGTLKPDFAHRYFRYLGIESWVKRWARGNSELASRAGIIPFPKR